jgi:hypothetical protein
LKWQELIELDDDGLDKRGVNALGARRKMLKVRIVNATHQPPLILLIGL